MILTLKNTFLVMLAAFLATLSLVLVTQPDSVSAQGSEQEICEQILDGDWNPDEGGTCTPKAGQASLFGPDGTFQKITNTLIFITGAISVLMLIVGGIRYTVSAGDANAVTGAKNTIIYAVVGIIVSFLAYAIVNFIITRI